MNTADLLPEGFPAVVSARPLDGGSISEVALVTLADGRTVVVKTTPYDAGLEAEGLRALADVGAPVPDVLAVTTDRLVLTHVTGPADWERLGALLATAHTAEVGRSFGWERANVIGPLPQTNRPTPDWPTFYVEQRVRAHLPHATALPADVRERVERLCDRSLPTLLDHDVVPSLVHGDLWSGNIVAGSWLIDPAVHRADRELDLAFLDLFGGVPETLMAGYDTVARLDDGWQERRPALQLHHLLVHVRLFGAGYVRSLVERVERLERRA